MLMGSFGNGGEPEQLRQCLTRAREILMVMATSCTLHHGLMQSCEIKIMCMGKNMKSEGMELQETWRFCTHKTLYKLGLSNGLRMKPTMLVYTTNVIG